MPVGKKVTVSAVQEKECRTCRWWIVMKPSNPKLWGVSEFPFGECRSNPPTALSGDAPYYPTTDQTGQIFVNIKQARFPHTFPDDWCGRWEGGLD